MEIQLWRELLEPYQLTVDELMVKFRHVMDEHHIKGIYSPIESIDGRVKSIVSILDKMQNKNISMNEIEEKILDIAGLRITCQFVEDIDRVVQLIKQRSDMEVVSEKDYITNMKESGYRSYHMIISYEVNTIQGARKVMAEIQIRTMAMNFWATVEHSLQYKYKGNIPEHIQQKLMHASEAIETIDEVMSSVRDEIMDAQNFFKVKENLIKDILHNINNLYKVANQTEVVKIQDEFYNIYTRDDMTELKHFANQLDIIAEGYRAQSV